MQLSRERIHGASTHIHRHTLERLRAGCSAADCADVCGTLAAVLDEAFAGADSSAAGIACAAGCDFCCHLRVSAFAHEAAAVLHRLRTAVAPAVAADIERRIVATAGRLEGMTVTEHYAARIPCALLVDGRCSVYAVRPSACAAHHSLSRARCEQAFERPEQHGTPRNSRPALLELQTLGDALIAATQSALEQGGRDATRRELHQALRDLIEGRSEAIIGGDPSCDVHSTSSCGS